jgi:hypothetical protein
VVGFGYILFSIDLSIQISLKMCNKALKMLVVKKILSLTYPSHFPIIAPLVLTGELYATM